MSDCLVYEASVLFAVITGTSATLLSLLLWSVFRRTPIGTLVFSLLVVMSLFTVQNGLVLLVGCDVPLVRLLKSGVNTSVLILVSLLFLTLHDFGGES